ncbi:MAG: spermidine/putrescine ABC transporter substrate-binding protein [Anaerolineae bacterium]|nr:spermidine/putrescine ABC transporter substrate-binding protein [Anaerolineae bacterium]
MKKILLSMFMILIMIGVAACGPSDTADVGGETDTSGGEEADTSGGEADTSDAKEDGGTLYFYTWSEYIDPDIYAQFKEETGITVVEDIFGSNEDLLAKLQGGATGYDVYVPSDYMVEIMIELDMLAELDQSRLETIGNLDPTFTNPPFDPNMGHCLPYFWGTTGIGYNLEDWDEPPDSWAYIFDPELASNFSGQITMLDDMREVFGSALIYLGYSAGTTDEAELAEARDLVLGIKEHLYSFESDTYEDLMLTGETRMSQGWSGDIFAAAVEDENLWYIIPKEGAVMWVDNLCISADAGADPERLDRVYQWLDYLNRADIAAQNTNWVWYASPNAAAEDGILEEILTEPAIYPDAETMERLEFLGNVGDFTETYSRMWTEIKAAD